MQRSLVDFVLADAGFDIHIPATDSLNPADILASPQRHNVFHGMKVDSGLSLSSYTFT